MFVRCRGVVRYREWVGEGRPVPFVRTTQSYSALALHVCVFVEYLMCVCVCVSVDDDRRCRTNDEYWSLVWSGVWSSEPEEWNALLGKTNGSRVCLGDICVCV